MQLWGITDRGSVRTENQDTYHICMLDDTTALGVVCDGMGGARAGNVASAMASETVIEHLKEELPGTERADWGTRLIGSVEQANEALFRRSATEEECRGMGTTVVAALADKERVLVINVGDSRCYHINAETITQVTRDHSLVCDLVARGNLTPEEARCHPSKNLITRALGVERIVRPDLFELKRQPGSYLLLCSDGLSNTVTDPEMLYEVIHNGDPADCCQRLLDIALSRGAPDNVTAVLMQL